MFYKQKIEVLMFLVSEGPQSYDSLKGGLITKDLLNKELKKRP